MSLVICLSKVTILSKGNSLAKALSLNVSQSLYSDWGNFYAEIKNFPCALFDNAGYLIVESEQDILKYDIKVGKRTNIPHTISSLDDYVSTKSILAELPEEVVEHEYYEGAVSQVIVNRYERDPNARKKCLEHYGYNCFACGLNMGKVYGSIAEKFIHVHHEKPLSEIGETYKLDPIADLKPLCPNCHAIIHLKKPALTIAELKVLISSQ